MEEKKDYSKTLNLPQTDFSMRGNLPAKEPDMLNKFINNKVYYLALEKNKNTGKKFVLHDGPPYANGDIHAGHAIDKVLKDIIIRYKTMNGYYSPYVPGWDTHGLPIEKKVQQELKVTKDEVGVAKFREICKEYALDAVKRTAVQFERLGGLGDYRDESKRYLTLNKDFEAKQIGVFGKMYENGYIYRDLKPVYWCSDCETALAEAEIEYKDDTTTSIYVKFRVSKDKGLLAKYGDLKDTYIVIWTTTPWTLPGNQAITLNPDYIYAIVEANSSRYILAKDLVETVMSIGQIQEYKIIGNLKGSELENIICENPVIENKTSRVILGSDKDLFVSLDAGTGCVHTAPGHGHEDYLCCKRYKDIEIIVPVDSHGHMTKEAGQFEGMYYAKANKAIIEYLTESKSLFALKELTHPYPHCWRCKKPVIYRATTQWFASIDGFRKKALEEIKNVNWVPSWGSERMTNMIKDRTDWCISRQRCWGVPIPIFYCKQCGKELINHETISKIAKLFEEKGSNSWFEMTPEQILEKEYTCECGCTTLIKETDIMDVWFDSGTTHVGVLNEKYGLPEGPADMYMEGNDQYRGWFQSSLLTSVATKGYAPYKEVITHGMVVDGEGRKMSKSLGNGISPIKVVEEFGADILRLWATSSDYHSEIRLSNDILKQVSEVYKKIRNTIRFLLGNTYDFDPNIDMIEYEKRDELDKYMMYKLNKLIEFVNDAYNTYDYHLVYSELHRFCTAELSSKYLDVIKDRLYTFNISHKLRRSSQSTMYEILIVLTKMISPILVFTAEEIYDYMKHIGSRKQSILLEDFPQVDSKYMDDTLIEKWDKIFEVKESMAKDIEAARAEKIVGHSLDSDVTIYANGKDYEFIQNNKENIALVAIISELIVEKADKYKVKVEKSTGLKCPRCWTYSKDINKDGICKKCADNM
ncbi:MAG: isoleucine--tRNA ligase [Clostridia bacterium]